MNEICPLRRSNADAGDSCSMEGPRHRKRVRTDLMNRLGRTLRPALRFGLGLLSAAFLVPAGTSVPASSGVNTMNREFAGSISSDQATQEGEPTSSTESLFDLLFGQRENGAVTYDIPFPFTALTQRIAAQVAGQDGKPPAVLQVLIPLGRSLQRDAAEPDYFRYPRVILAVDGTPAKSPGHRGLLLKDRLYLGYQEKANAIEVISYNGNAGRFEFQVVHDYAPGLTPTVSYASRASCMGCHQNGGPI